jgi:Flp pilus assembly protein TadD
MKRFAVALGLILTLALGTTSAWAQSGSCSGKVVDQNGQPIPEVAVQFTHANNETRPYEGKTNKNGDFTVVTMQMAGPWMLTLKKPGYVPYQHPQPLTIPLRSTPTTLGTIRMWQEGAPGAPAHVSPEEAAKRAAEIKAIQAQFKQAVLLTQEGLTASQANDAALAGQKFDQAMALYDEMLASHNDLPDVHHNVGYLFGQRRAWQQAGEAYFKAAQIKNDRIEDYLAAGVAFQNASQRPKALEVLNEGLANNPDNPKLLLALGVAQYNGAQYAAAEATITKSQTLDPASPEPLYYLGMIAISQGKTKESLTLLEQYVAANPTNPDNLQSAKDIMVALRPAAPKAKK